MPAENCLPREKLKAYLAGWSDPTQSDVIETHLSECSLCEQTVIELERDPDTLVEFLRQSPAEDLPLAPEVAGALVVAGGSPGQVVGDHPVRFEDPVQAAELGGHVGDGEAHVGGEVLDRLADVFDRPLPVEEFERQYRV